MWTPQVSERAWNHIGYTIAYLHVIRWDEIYISGLPQANAFMIKVANVFPSLKLYFVFVCKVNEEFM